MSCRATQRLPAANDIQWIIATHMPCMDPIHVEKRGEVVMDIPGMEAETLLVPSEKESCISYSLGLFSLFADATLHICLHPPTGIRINVVPSNQWEECLSY